jgi:hypothetical protein
MTIHEHNIDYDHIYYGPISHAALFRFFSPYCPRCTTDQEAHLVLLGQNFLPSPLKGSGSYIGVRTATSLCFFLLRFSL